MITSCTATARAAWVFQTPFRSQLCLAWESGVLKSGWDCSKDMFACFRRGIYLDISPSDKLQLHQHYYHCSLWSINLRENGFSLLGLFAFPFLPGVICGLRRSWCFFEEVSWKWSDVEPFNAHTLPTPKQQTVWAVENSSRYWIMST